MPLVELIVGSDEFECRMIFSMLELHDSTERDSFFADGLGLPKLIQNKRLSDDKNPNKAPVIS